MSVARKLDFCIAGTQKAGTTALVRYLDQHSSLFFPKKKELHLFNRATHLEWKNRRAPDNKIAEHFEGATPGQLCGESTPAYMYWRDSFRLMAEHNPDMGIIICLRHPALRALSAWRMEVSRGRETLSFSDAIREGRSRVADAPDGQHKIFSYVERGFFSKQIETLYESFDRKNVFFIRSDMITASHPQMQTLLEFLGVSPITFDPIRENMFKTSKIESDETILQDLAYLQSIFQDDMAELPHLTGLDVQDWLSKAPNMSDLDWKYQSAP